MAGTTYMAWPVVTGAWPVVTGRDFFGYPLAAITAIDHVNTVAAR
jgi:hypothetical protein